MRHILFGSNAESLSIALLVKESCFRKQAIEENYIRQLTEAGVKPKEIIAFTLAYKTPKSAPAALRKKYLAELLPEIDQLGIKILYCTDGEYFKTLTKNAKAEPHYGYVCPCAIEGYEHLGVIIGVNYQALSYNPTLQGKLELSLQALIKFNKDTYSEPGTEIIHSEYYPDNLHDIEEALQALHQYDQLTCDIEAFSLKFYDAGIGTIAFAWDEHNGIAFAVDYTDGKQVFNAPVRELLKQFLTEYRGTLTYHNIFYDAKVLIYNLWMNDLGDNVSMLDGIELLHSKFDDTKLIAYLATNNTVKNELGLKILAQPFAGNYAEDDIKDIRLIPLVQLLRYNLIDTLSTWYVYKKYKPIMIEEDQLHVYLDTFKPSVKLILQTELTGMPISPEKVQEAKIILTDIVKEHSDALQNSHIIKDFHYIQLEDLAAEMTHKAVKKVYTADDQIIARNIFNPGSDKQLQELIYNYLGYEVIDTTDSGLPATGAKTLEKLINHAKSDSHKEIFEHLIGLSKANKILTSFIPAFEKAQQLPDGSYRVYGNFNLSGTQSGRLSSSDSNMQNLPSGSKFGKLIKSCFVSDHGWLFTGADFASLEDRINALLTSDPNKLRVYTDGYDAHSLRAYYYFGDQMPDIKEALPTERVFKIIVDNRVVYGKSGDFIIDLHNNKIPIEDYYETSKRI